MGNANSNENGDEETKAEADDIVAVDSPVGSPAVSGASPLLAPSSSPLSSSSSAFSAPASLTPASSLYYCSYPSYSSAFSSRSSSSSSTSLSASSTAASTTTTTTPITSILQPISKSSSPPTTSLSSSTSSAFTQLHPHHATTPALASTTLNTSSSGIATKSAFSSTRTSTTQQSSLATPTFAINNTADNADVNNRNDNSGTNDHERSVVNECAMETTNSNDNQQQLQHHRELSAFSPPALAQTTKSALVTTATTTTPASSAATTTNSTSSQPISTATIQKDAITGRKPAVATAMASSSSSVPTTVTTTVALSASTKIAEDSDKNADSEGFSPPDDGYKWRKYGRKKVKGSNFTRSYFKCMYENCAVRKHTEATIDEEGKVVLKSVYVGDHTHDAPTVTRLNIISDQLSFKSSILSVGQKVLETGPPQKATNNTKTSSTSSTNPTNCISTNSQCTISNLSSSASAAIIALPSISTTMPVSRPAVASSSVVVSPTRPATTSSSQSISKSSSPSTTPLVQKSKQVVQLQKLLVETTAGVDFLDDGYNWRKYGQKNVKGSTYPRSYYKCTEPGCSMKKQVEKQGDTILNIYEGQHNHLAPGYEEGFSTALLATLPKKRRRRTNSLSTSLPCLPTTNTDHTITSSLNVSTSAFTPASLSSPTPIQPISPMRGGLSTHPIVIPTSTTPSAAPMIRPNNLSVVRPQVTPKSASTKSQIAVPVPSHALMKATTSSHNRPNNTQTMTTTTSTSSSSTSSPSVFQYAPSFNRLAPTNKNSSLSSSSPSS